MTPISGIGTDDDTLQQGAGPFGTQVDFNLSVPPIEARMVNANALEDYEIWFFFSSLLFSAAVGFVVAYVQSLNTDQPDKTSLVVTIIFGVLFLLSLIRVISLRRRLAEESTTYPMRAVSMPARPREELQTGSPATDPPERVEDN